ncbi:unnamed protein product [Callosobruchus maculatus]|uniref:Uncharacterized protein n=1 Tax=Callosobruchus maculatus TaxID=64391 RepID=A0A653DB15_CALMS|nr:unnamed protein product [Callosobruchus maculatus]
MILPCYSKNNNIVFFSIFTVLEPVRPFLLLFDWSSAFLLTRLNTPYWQKPFIAGMIKKAYFRDKYLSSAPKEELAQYFSDQMFVRPLTKSAKLLSRHTNVFSTFMIMVFQL